MKLVRMLVGVACAAAFVIASSTALAESCCVKAKVAGKDCAHQCCIDAHKAAKTCEKCQTEASCCDKAIATAKACAHQCCADALKEKKVCEKCNPPKKEEKK